jgi:hypothetical protein
VKKQGTFYIADPIRMEVREEIGYMQKNGSFRRVTYGSDNYVSLYIQKWKVKKFLRETEAEAWLAIAEYIDANIQKYNDQIKVLKTIINEQRKQKAKAKRFALDNSGDKPC